MDRPRGRELLQLLNRPDPSIRQEYDHAQWVLSYVTDHAITCVYLAEDADAVREHAECGGFPVTTIRRVGAVIDPTTGEPA